MDPLEVAGLAVTLVGSLLGFLAIARRLSGKIATSEAGALWDAQEAFRISLATQLLQANERFTNLEVRFTQAEVSRLALERENWELRRENHGCEQLVATLRAEIARLKEGT